MKNLLRILVLLGLASSGFAQSGTTDEAAIKKLIEDEVGYNKQRDLAKWLGCYAQSEDLVLGFGPGMTRGYDEVAKALKAFLEKLPEPSKAKTVIADYRIRQRGNTAFVSSIQLDTAPDGTQTRWNKVNYLEKLNGEWKIIGDLFRSEPVAK